jgi:type IV secretory pathway VirJ component
MRMRRPRRLALAATAVVALCAPLAACGGQTAGLIPAADAGPLESDFEAVARAAQAGDGSCTATEAALERTQRALEKLAPARVSAALRARLEKGMSNLSKVALERCAQRTSATTTTHSTTRSSASVRSVESTTTETSTTAASTPTSSPAPEAGPPGGGTQAPEGKRESPAEQPAEPEVGAPPAHGGGPGAEAPAAGEHGRARGGPGGGGR